MKGYKAFNKEWKCRDFQYKIGETYELPEGQELKMCKCGFHFCENPIDVFGYYNDTLCTVVAEVEALGDIQQEGTKYCTNKIKIVREVTREELQELIVDDKCNTGKKNCGEYNSGYKNIGNYNSGDYNSGDCNSGSRNAGDSNIGFKNVGHYNSGDSNTGNRNEGCFNSGSCNIGHHNSGDFNEGNYNTGNYNEGNYNVGSYNTGHSNTGYFNTCNFNSGMFNTTEPKMRIFNKECDMTSYEFFMSTEFGMNVLLDKIYRKDLDAKDIEHIKSLPNFDADIFKETTGIDIEEEERKIEEGNNDKK